MLTGITIGVVGTLLVLFVAALVYPRLSDAVLIALWKIRDSNDIVYAIWDTWLRQTDRRLGPKLNVTRQARRRIAREMARRMT